MHTSNECDDLSQKEDKNPKRIIKSMPKEYSIDSEEAPLSTDIIRSSSGVWIPM